MVKFSVSRTERMLISKIAERAVRAAVNANIEYEFNDAEMDITACHCNGCPLDLNKLLIASDFDFAHDVFGIRRHINRETGKIENCFLPRCAAPDAEVRHEQSA